MRARSTDRRQPHQPGDRLERAGQPQHPPDVAPVDPVGVEVAVAVPGGPVGARVAGQGPVGQQHRGVGAQPQAQAHPAGRRPVGQERQVERTAVPRGDDAGRQRAEVGVERGQQLGLRAVEDVVAPGRGEAHRTMGDTAGQAVERVWSRVEPVDGDGPGHAVSMARPCDAGGTVRIWRRKAGALLDRVWKKCSGVPTSTISPSA